MLTFASFQWQLSANVRILSLKTRSAFHQVKDLAALFDAARAVSGHGKLGLTGGLSLFLFLFFGQNTGTYLWPEHGHLSLARTRAPSLPELAGGLSLYPLPALFHFERPMRVLSYAP